MTKTRILCRGLIALTLMFSLSGCLLKSLLGLVEVDEDGTNIRLALLGVSTARCQEDPLTEFQFILCTYFIETEDGSVEVPSTAELLSDFGVLGLVIDPVIVQVPLNSEVLTATVDDGSGAQPLRVMQTPTFNVTPTEQATAEAGMTFLIVELPEAIEAILPEVPTAAGPLLDFEFDFRMPVQPVNNVVEVKAMYAGRVEQGGETYYFPMFPCTADFSQIEPIRFPAPSSSLAGFIFNLLFRYMDNEDQACDGMRYDFTQVATGPLQCDGDLDGDVDRRDISLLLGNRNMPASGPDDPFDRDGDGTITVLDARQCARECTRPACAVN